MPRGFTGTLHVACGTARCPTFLAHSSICSHSEAMALLPNATACGRAGGRGQGNTGQAVQVRGKEASSEPRQGSGAAKLAASGEGRVAEGRSTAALVV